MKILPIIITAFFVLVSCDKSAQNSTDSASTATKTADSVSATTENVVQNTPASPSGAATVASSTTSAPAAATSTSGRPALNPAHGEPYHRCEIAVGAPIDSAPTQKNSTPMVSQPAPSKSFNTNPIATPAATPVTASAPATGPKPATNPAHGQPHHRCDLAVGAPLI